MLKVYFLCCLYVQIDVIVHRLMTLFICTDWCDRA